MTKSLERFKQAQAIRGGGRYSSEARSYGLLYARGELSKGRTVTAIAGDLGVDGLTLRTWLKCAEKPQTSGSFCEVILEPSTQARKGQVLTVTTVEGHVVSGLDLEGAAALLRALA